jgi:hypothetical protein
MDTWRSFDRTRFRALRGNAPHLVLIAACCPSLAVRAAPAATRSWIGRGLLAFRPARRSTRVRPRLVTHPLSFGTVQSSQRRPRLRARARGPATVRAIGCPGGPHAGASRGRRPGRRRTPEEPAAAIYRGWMLTPDQYRSMHGALSARGITLINSPEAYRTCHYLPDSYPFIEGRTPKTASRSKPRS